MKLKCLSLILMAVCCIFYAPLHAQNWAHFNIGSSRNEIATVVKPLADGSSYIGGYIYDTGSYSDLHKADMLLLHVLTDGTIDWQRTIKSDSDYNDYINDLIVARNGDIIAVGVAGRGNNISSHAGASIMRFSPSGVMLHKNVIKDNSGLDIGGEVYFGVAELDNGNIVAVGAHNYMPSVADGLITVFKNDLSLIYNEKRQIPSTGKTTDYFHSVVAWGNSVFILGLTYDDPSYIMTLMSYTPGISSYSSTTNWLQYYDFSYILNDKTVAYTLDSKLPFKVTISNNKLLVSGVLLQSNSSVNRHFLFTSDFNNNNPTCSIVEYPDPSMNKANTTTLVPVTANEAFITEIPSTHIYDPVAGPMGSTYNVTASHLNSITGGAVVNSSQFTIAGSQDVEDIQYANQIVYFAGAVNSNSTYGQNNDIYFVESSPSLTDPNSDSTSKCSAPQNISLINLNIRNADMTFTFDSFAYHTINLSVDTPDLRSNLLCGDATVYPGTGTNGVCDETCYWKLDGNHISPSINKVLGTLTKYPLKMVTNSTERARIDEDGQVGIQTNAPQAVLDVDCSVASLPTAWPSGLRFRNLPYGSHPVLVIDSNGYVFIDTTIASGNRPGNTSLTQLEKEIDQLKQEIQTLKNLIYGTSGISGTSMTDGTVNALTISPNPNNGDFTAAYTISKTFRSAQIKITDISNRSLILNELPANIYSGTIRITLPGNIAAGQILCTLIVDGNVITTQKVVVTGK